MRIDETRTYWILLMPKKFSGVPWFIRETGLPIAERATRSIREAKRFTSRDDAVEWGNHLGVPVLPKKIVETCTYISMEEP